MSNTPKVVDREALKEFRKRNDQRYVLEGEYSPSTKVGESDVADNMTPYSEQSGATDTTPFVFQSSGGSSDIGSLAYLKALRGNSVAFNQQFVNGDFSNGTNNWATTANVGTLSSSNRTLTWTYSSQGTGAFMILSNTPNYKPIPTHKYLIKLTAKGSSNFLLRFSCGGQNADFNITTTKTQFSAIVETTSNSYAHFAWRTNGPVVGDTIEFNDIQLFDLTLMFGAGNEPTTVAEFNRLFPKPYYEYNAGELLSCKVNGYKVVGYNAFDKSLAIDNKRVLATNGTTLTVNGVFISDYIKVIAGQTYTLSGLLGLGTSTGHICAFYDADKNYISGEQNLIPSVDNVNLTVPANACYIVFNGLMTNKDTTCFHLTWDGTRTGYEPYETKTYPMPNVELKSAGNAYDELKPDGTLIRRIGSYTFTGEEEWTAGASNRYYWAGIRTVINPPSTASVVGNLKYSSGDLTLTSRSESDNLDKVIFVFPSREVGIKDTTNVTSTATAASFMAGKTIYFELATPTEEVVTGYQEITPIDDWGTQEFLYDSDIDIPVPQGNEFFYPVDYKAFIDSVGGRNDIEYDAGQIVSLTQLNNFLKTITGYDATKNQSLKNVNGTIQWVDEE